MAEPDRRRDRSPPRGVYCPKCWCTWCPVYYTRSIGMGRIRRCRICKHCNHRIYTTEAAPKQEKR